MPMDLSAAKEYFRAKGFAYPCVLGATISEEDVDGIRVKIVVLPFDNEYLELVEQNGKTHILKAPPIDHVPELDADWKRSIRKTVALLEDHRNAIVARSKRGFGIMVFNQMPLIGRAWTEEEFLDERIEYSTNVINETTGKWTRGAVTARQIRNAEKVLSMRNDMVIL